MIYQNNKILAASLTSNGGTSQDVYSTEEQVIGRWIDWKPLYRRVFRCTTPTILNKHTAVSPGAENVDTMVKIYGCVQNVILGDVLSCSSINYGSYIFTTYDKKTSSIRMYVSSGVQAGLDSYVVLEYTKTTDQATIPIETDQTFQNEFDLTTDTIQFSPMPVTVTDVKLQ